MIEQEFLNKIIIHTSNLIPDNWLCFKTEKYTYLFERGIEIRLDNKIVNIDNYLEKLFKK